MFKIIEVDFLKTRNFRIARLCLKATIIGYYLTQAATAISNYGCHTKSTLACRPQDSCTSFKAVEMSGGERKCCDLNE